MFSFKEYLLLEATNLGAGELGKPNSSTGEKRTDILRNLIKHKSKIELVDGKFFVVGDIDAAMTAINQFEQDGKTFSLVDTAGNSISLTKIKKSAVFGGGGGGAGGGSASTAIVESAQCLWCAAMLEIGHNADISEFTDEVLSSALKHVDVGSTKINDILNMDESWRKSAYLSAKYLIENGYIKKGMKFHRDSSVMKSIYATKNAAYKNNGFKPLKDDKWNPGDIWAVSESFDIKSIDTSSVKSLQKSILENFVNRTCVGISLKKINKNVKGREINVELPPDVDDHKVLEIREKSKKGTFWSAKNGEVEYDDGNITFKDNSSFGIIKAEIKGKTARGGGAGWGTIQEAASQAFGKTLPSTKEITQVAKKIEKGDKKLLDKFYNMILQLDPNMSRKEYDSEIVQKDAVWIHAKYGVTLVLSLLKSVGGQKGNRFITKLVNYAGSKTEDSSAYIKVYE